MDDLKRSRVFLFTLIAITAIGPFAMQMFVPSLPAIQAGFGVPVGLAQLALSLSILSIAVATLGYGPFSDRFGRRPVLIVGLVGYLVGTALCILAPSIWLLILGRIVQAAGGAAGMVIARAMVRDVFGRERMATVIAYLTMAMVVVPMVAPVAGGVVNDLAGWRAVFVVALLAGIATLAMVMAGLGETHHEREALPGMEAMLAGFGRLLAMPAFRGYALQAAFSVACFFAFMASAPYLVVNVMGRTTTEYGLWLMLVSVTFMAGNFIAARLTRRFGTDRMILLGSLMALAGALALSALAGAHVWTPAAIFGPTALIGLANGIAMPNAQAGAIGIDARLTGTASGLAGFLQMFIAAVFAQATGMLENGTPYPMAAFMTLAAALSLAAALVPFTTNRRAAAV
jgi:DHA1 family bicyclomycin/chloramphenicol resistance-like MFS transporter